MQRYPKLRGRIVEKFGTIDNFGKNLDISIVSISKKLNGTTGFSQADIIEWSKLLEIEMNEVGNYFFDN